MGVSERYEEAEREAWRKLPLRERYRWRAILTVMAIAVVWIVITVLMKEDDTRCELSGGAMTLVPSSETEMAWVCKTPEGR